MKRVYIGMFALAAFSILFSACSEDEALAKKLVIDGESIKLSHGFIQGLGAARDNNGDLVSIYGVGLTTSDLTIEDGEPVGEGSVIFMQLVSPTSLNLASGTYEVTDNEIFEKSIAMSFVMKNYDAETNESEESYQAVSGTIKISKSGSTYKITFNMVMSDIDLNEVVVKGSFEGKLTEAVIYGGNA